MFKKLFLFQLLALFEGINSKCYENEITCLDDDANINFGVENSFVNYSLTSSEHSDYNVTFWHNNSCNYDIVMHYGDDLENECLNRKNIPGHPNPEYIGEFEIAHSNCSKIKVSFCLSYWFNGCYIFEIKLKDCIKSDDFLIIHPVWIYNEIEPKNFEIEYPHFIYESDSGTNLTLKWIFNNESIIDNELKYNIILPNDGKCINRTYVDVRFIIECKLTNWYPGNYTVNLKILDPWRCENKYKKQNCKWFSIFVKRNATEIISKVDIQSSSFTLPWVAGIGIGMACFALIFISGFVYRYFRKKNLKRILKRSFNHICDDAECCSYDKHINGILLLYPRDCEAFMEVMKQFRILLATSTECKVYDLFDEMRFNDIAESSESWIQTLIHDPHIKILIPATQCADILYQNLLNHCTNAKKDDCPSSHVRYYKEPNFLDTLFMYALKMISFDVTPVPYHKFYVFRFSHMDESDAYLPHINPFKRFQLPKNLQKLFDTVMGYGQTNKTEIIEIRPESLKLDDFKTALLTNSLESLKKYMKMNPSYLLDEILNSQIENNLQKN